MAKYDVEIVTFVTTAIGESIGKDRLSKLLSDGYVIVATIAAADNQPTGFDESFAIVTVILQRKRAK